MKKYLSITILILLGTAFIYGQEINPDLLKKSWKAMWITVSKQHPQDYGVYYFRKEIELKEKPKSFVVQVSGDNRYKFFVNGQMVSLGPARNDLYHWNFETIDIASYLKTGKNTICSIVWNEGANRASAQISSATAFILQGNGNEESIVNTGRSWKGIKMDGFNAIKPTAIGYFIAPFGEFSDMIKGNSEWMSNGFDDSSWKSADIQGAGFPKGVNPIGANQWMLVPSQLPQMERTPQRLLKMRVAEGINIPSGFPAIKKQLTIPANTKVRVVLDQTFLTNAYPVFQYSKGKGAAVLFTYAESFYDEKSMEKGNRNTIENKKIFGVKDSIICNGKKEQTFTALNWKTFRYVQLDVTTANEPLIIDDFYAIYTAYPFKNNSVFTSDNPIFTAILDNGWRTARLCAMETYMDTPFYEQLQYAGDTGIQALISYYNSGDDRLARQAINAIDYSRLSEGITQSRFPATGDNIIPPFSLIWIGMLNDYYHYRPDADFVKMHLPGVRQILSFYQNFQQEDGTIKNAPYWNFIDWPENARGWKAGVPPLNADGGSAALDLQLLWGYQWAAELENNLGLKELANLYSEKAKQLRKTIISKYWDDSKKMFADTDKKNSFSQHANTLAILTETIKGNDAQQLFRAMTQDNEITRASIYFQYYVNQALRKVGLGNEYENRLQIWKDNLALGMTTWGEDSDVKSTRSDCHAWGASPNIELFRTVLGIDAAEIGFSKVIIEPHLGTLKKASGKIPHPNGEIAVNYGIDKKGTLTATIVLPKGLTGTFVWKGQEKALQQGINSIKL